MTVWNQVKDTNTIQKAISALKENGIDARLVADREEAKKAVFELLPLGAEVMDMTSVTLETIGVAQEIQESSKYISVKKKLFALDRKTQGREMQKLGSAPDFVVGSVHAVTEDGKVLVASNTGSQLPAYAYGAGHVIWAVGAQKIVKNLEEGMKRIYEYCLPLESERAKKAYGVAGSSVNKVLTIHKEVNLGRITLLFVPEVLGY